MPDPKDNQPKDHHYLPQFYLKRWVRPETRKLWAYQRFQPDGPVIVEAKTARAIGYQRELYAVKTRTDPAARQATEASYLSPLDSAAAEALSALETTGRRPTDPKLVEAWIRFLMSLMFRSPQHLDVVLEELRAHNAEVLAKLGTSYARLRGASDPPTFEDYLRAPGVADGQVEELKDDFLRGMIDSPLLGGATRNLCWEVFTLPHRKHGFLTGDEPVMASNGLGVEGGFMVLPIGPRRVFLAAQDPDHVAGFTDWPERLERAFNDAIVCQSRRLVVGDSDGQKEFVSKRLGTAVPQGRFKRHAYSLPARRPPRQGQALLGEMGGGWRR